MSGLAVAFQALIRDPSLKICILEKEASIGLHSSGRNSGVLHAGLYYPPASLKSHICVSGAKRLKQYLADRNLPILNCGKVIVPQSTNLDPQLDILLARGQSNGAEVHLIDSNDLASLAPGAITSSGRAIWSPNTSIVNPKLVLQQIYSELCNKGVIFYFSASITQALNRSTVQLSNGCNISFGHLFNCAGLYADQVASLLGYSHPYQLIPFKGLYWSLHPDSPINCSTNVYPVPDDNLPFLGVHFTPSAADPATVSVGPTATLAFGRENYRGMQNLSLKESLANCLTLSRMLPANKNNIRTYITQQSMLMIKPLLVSEAKKIYPKLESHHLTLSPKVGIRPQLVNSATLNMEHDFICNRDDNKTHLLNAISPAFTSSFSLGDLILDSTNI